jgi:hypothetical protein
MGVYHLMGLGRSIGAITGPLSYLAHRFQRWDQTDRDFFGTSGEVEQRERDEKVGDVQALVLFSTGEVLRDELKCYPYVVNQPGLCRPNAKAEAEMSIRDALRRVLPNVLRTLAKGRKEVKLYWVEVDRTDLLSTFQRIAAVILCVKSVGSLGKETWINLTGGNNVINLALQFAPELTGMPARFYYVQAENPDAEKCVYFSREYGYWVDLPLLPVRAHEASRKLVELVARERKIEVTALLTKGKEQFWEHLQDATDQESFQRSYLQPLYFQELLRRTGDILEPGARWPRIKPYYETLDALDGKRQTLRELTSEPWFREEELSLR